MKRFLLITILLMNLTFYAEEFFVKVDGAEIFCETMGKGDPIIVIQGGPGIPHDEWVSPLLSKLAETHFIIFFDHRASGRSTGEMNADTMRFDIFLNDLEAIRKSFGLEKISLIGECWGGSLAMKYVITYPELVDKLILLYSLPPSFEEMVEPSLEFQSRVSPYRKEMFSIKVSPEFLEGDQEAVNQYYKLTLLPHFYHPEKAEEFVRNHPITWQTLVDRKKMVKTFIRTECYKYFNWHNQLQTLKHPTLIVHGDSDWNSTLTAESIHKTISNSQLVILKDCGHIAILEKPDEVFKAVRDFLDAN